LVLLHMGFSLPGAIARPAVRSYRTISPLLTSEPASGIFSVALIRSVRFERKPPAVSRHAAL
jgi:hypothetical protein